MSPVTADVTFYDEDNGDLLLPNIVVEHVTRSQAFITANTIEMGSPIDTDTIFFVGGGNEFSFGKLIVKPVPFSFVAVGPAP